MACYLLNNENDFEHCIFVVEKMQFGQGMWPAIISKMKAILNVFLLKKCTFSGKWGLPSSQQ